MTTKSWCSLNKCKHSGCIRKEKGNARRRFMLSIYIKCFPVKLILVYCHFAVLVAALTTLFICSAFVSLFVFEQFHIANALQYSTFIVYQTLWVESSQVFVLCSLLWVCVRVCLSERNCFLFALLLNSNQYDTTYPIHIAIWRAFCAPSANTFSSFFSENENGETKRW